MAILGKDILSQHGPYVSFAVLDPPLSMAEDTWPRRDLYAKGIFFEWSDDLLSCYCGITRSYSPFDPHSFTELRKSQEIYEFSAKLLLWELQVANAPDLYFRKESEWLNDTFHRQPDENGVTCESLLKVDLLETLHYVVGQLHQAAAAGKCVVIVGF